MRSQLPLAACVLSSALAAQSISYSRLDFQNAYRTTTDIEFPNSRSLAGNVDGDLLYKSFPVEIIARDAPIRISGLRLSWQLGKDYTGAFPVSIQLPAVVFYPVVKRSIGGVTLDVPDLLRPHSKSLPLPSVLVSRRGVFVYEFKLGPQQADPGLRAPISLANRDTQGALQGWAVALRARTGERLGDGKPHFAAAQSFGEIHRLKGPPTYSGMWDAKAQVFKPFGTVGAPSNVGELAVELLIDGPTLQCFSPAAGGVRNDPRRLETGMGPGAYRNLLGSAISPGWIGMYQQWEGHSTVFDWCLPFLMALGDGQPSKSLPVGGITMLWDPPRSIAPDIFLNTGVFGPLGTYKAGGIAGRAVDQDGVFATPQLAVPNDASFRGRVIWLQSLMINLQRNSFDSATNLVRAEF